MSEPSLTLAESLHARSRMYSTIRRFFNEKNVLEVDVPLLGLAGVTDPFVNNIRATFHNQTYCLQTSPEYFMKRLLCDVHQSMYYLGKAFREDMPSPKHNPEFTMLEWYRLGFDEHHLMDEVAELIGRFLPTLPVKKITYQALFREKTGLCPHQAPIESLANYAKARYHLDWHDELRSTWLDLIFTHLIEPSLTGAIYFIYDYPQCQSALAQLATRDQITVARRFEVFIEGVELANGYFELTNVDDQQARFEQDNRLRDALGLPLMPIDHALVAAMHKKGLPVCAGVALGVDRLLMLALEQTSLHAVLPFAFNKATP